MIKIKYGIIDIMKKVLNQIGNNETSFSGGKNYYTGMLIRQVK